MTREEAITRLHWLKRELIKGTDMNEPIDMAIESLERERIKCSHCKHYIRHDHKCGWWNHGVSNVDWCSYGKRREE